MVDISAKPVTERRAEAQARLICARETLDAIAAGTAPKGAVITTAEIAGIMGAKRTAELIPLCHPLPLDSVTIEINLDHDLPGLHIRASVKCSGQTGAEMEALTGASLAALTLFDMLKAIDKTMVIEGLRVTSKSGGKSGDWAAGEEQTSPDSAA